MKLKSRRSITALMLVLSLLGACSSPDGPETAEGDRTRVPGAEKKDDKGAGKGGGKGAKQPKPGKGNGGDGGGGGGQGGNNGMPEPGESPPAASSGTTTAPQSFASQGPPSPVDPSLANRMSTIEDPSNDSEKEGALVPSYSEMTRAVFQGQGEQFQITLSFNGAVPEKMPDDKTIMVIGVGISAGGNDTYGFTAQGTPEGWKAYAGAKDGAKKFPGQFLIENGEIVMRIPWKFINGPREFRWQVNSTWFKSVANTSHYAFDMAPNKESAQFPD